jgi:hypothetical protein
MIRSTDRHVETSSCCAGIFYWKKLKMYRFKRQEKTFRFVTIVVKCHFIPLKIISLIIILLRNIKIGL